MIAVTGHRPWMQTTQGHRFYFDDPREGVITIRDVARALSRIPRFNGHGDTDVVISVAEHSVAVSQVVEARGRRDLALAALLHDASEAYLCDISTPHKSCVDMVGYREREGHTMDAVERAFRLAKFATRDIAIKQADLDCLATEVRLHYSRVDPGWEAWLAGTRVVSDVFVYHGYGWRDAESEFMERYRELRGGA